MAHNNNNNNYSTPDHLRLPSIRSIGVYPTSNNNNNNGNNNNNASVDYAQQQQQQQVQSQVRYSEEYYSHSNNRDMGYYGHDPSSNASNTTSGTTTSTGTQAHSHSSNNSTPNSSSGPNVSPYRRPRTLTSNVNNHGTMHNAKYNQAHAHHHSSISTASSSGGGSSASVSAANSGSLGTTGAASGGGQTPRSSSYNSTYSGQQQQQMTYPDYYTQRGSAATTTTAAGSTGTNTGAASWYYAQNPNSSHSQSQTLSQQPTASPVVQQKPNPMHSQSQHHYSHTASPSQSPVSALPQQQQQQQYYQQPQTQGQNQGSYSQSTMHGHSNPVPNQSQQQNPTRTPRFQSMHPASSSSLHPSGGVYSNSNDNSTGTHHGHHIAIPSMNSSSTLAGGNGNAPAPIPTSPAPTSTNAGLIQNLEEDANRAAAEGMYLNKIIEHCEVLRTFADHYAHQPQGEGSPAPNSATPSNTSAGNPGPTPPEMTEMAQRANIVLKLVDQMRKLAGGVNVNIPGFASIAANGSNVGMDMDDDSLYKKKRSWGDEDGVGNIPGEDIESLAHQDMALIRSKRAQGVGSNTAPGGNAKAKYRKRSRATPPGKCHSCNIRETPEWRRGPDGARTLCNACGLHYAKLIRKRDKTVGSGNVDLPPISVEMLRASTRADSAKHHHANTNINVNGSISLSNFGGATSSISGTSGSSTTNAGSGSGLGPPGSSASPSGGTGSNSSSSEMTEIALQPIGGPPSHSATASSSGVTLSPVSSSNVSLTGPGRSVSNNGGGLNIHPWSSSGNVYRYTGSESGSSVSGGAGSSYHSHSSAHPNSHPHAHSLPPPPHHHGLRLPHPLQRSGGYDGYSTSLMRTSASVGGDGRASPGV